MIRAGADFLKRPRVDSYGICCALSIYLILQAQERLQKIGAHISRLKRGARARQMAPRALNEIFALFNFVNERAGASALKKIRASPYFWQLANR